jgi:hypothetical protein
MKAMTDSPTHFGFWIADFRLSDRKQRKAVRDLFVICLVPNQKLKIENPKLLDDPICSHQHPLRNGQADLFGCLEIDHQFELGWLLDREIGGLSAFENLVHQYGCAPPQIEVVGPIGHQSAGIYISARGKNMRYPTLYHTLHNPDAEQRVSMDHKAPGALLFHVSKGTIDIVTSGDRQGEKHNTQRWRRRLKLL